MYRAPRLWSGELRRVSLRVPPAQHIYRVSSLVLLALALIALLAVLVGLAQPPEPRRSDEGALARIFQLTVVALVPTGTVVLATADWHHPRRVAQLFTVAGVLVMLAFAALYYLEHLR